MNSSHKVRQYVAGFSCRGLSLIELMVALIIGLMLSGAVTVIYVNDKHANVVQNNMANLQENGRMALHLLREDVRMAGYWGMNFLPETISHGTENVSLGSECADGWASDGWAEDYPRPFASENNDNTAYLLCIPDADHKANTDILTIRHASSEPVADGDIQKDHLYLLTSLTDGSVFKADSAGSRDSGISVDETTPLPLLYEVLAHAYYVRPWSEADGDGIPSLAREVISGGALTAELLVEYVEDFQVTFGLDTNGDGGVDLYDNDGILDSDIPKVMSIVVDILVRADTAEANYTNTRTYQLGDLTVGPFNDGFRRQVFSDTLFVRNWSGLGT